MKAPEPRQEYIDELVQSNQAEEEIDHQKLVNLLFTIIDHFMLQQPDRCKPGPKPTYSDNTILKLDMLIHLTGKKVKPKSCEKPDGTIVTTSTSYQPKVVYM